MKSIKAAAPLLFLVAALTACENGDGKVDLPKADEKWCEESVSQHLDERDGPAEGQPDFTEVSHFVLASDKANERTCAYTGVVGKKDDAVEVQSWQVEFAHEDGAWVAKKESPYVHVAAPDDVESVDPAVVAAEGAAGAVVAVVAKKPKSAPADLDAAKKHKPFERALGETTELSSYRFSSLEKFEVCVVHTESGAWAKATPEELTSGHDGGNCK